MSDNGKLHLLATAAAALKRNTRDLSAWWKINEAFRDISESSLAIDGYVDLGHIANELAMVSLSLSCVLRLKEMDATKESDELLSKVAKKHCKGAKGIGRESASPPCLPASLGEMPSLEKTLSEIKKMVQKAVKEAKKTAPKRYPAFPPATPLINHLNTAELETLVSVMSLKVYERGTVIVDVGDKAHLLFWLARGIAEVSRKDKLLGELHSDAIFGEIALVGATRRTARVTCLERCYVLEMPALEIETLAAKTPNLARVLATHARVRLLHNVTRTSELFRRLSSEEKKLLLPKFETCFADANACVIEAGKENNNLYVLVTGECEVRDGDTVLKTLRVGEGFGEMSMLGRKKATCDVVAKQDVVLLRVTRSMFDEIAMVHPELLSEVYKLLVQRERENHSIDLEVIDADELVI